MNPERLHEIKDELNCITCEELVIALESAYSHTTLLKNAYDALTTENRVLRESIFDVLAKGSGKGCPSCGSYLGDAMDSQPHAKECKIAAALAPSAASTAAQEPKIGD